LIPDAGRFIQGERHVPQVYSIKYLAVKGEEYR